MGFLFDFFDKALDKLEESFDDGILGKAVDSLSKNEKLAESVNNAYDFVDSTVKGIRGEYVQHLHVDGVDVSSQASHSGEKLGTQIRTVVNVLTPEQWKQVGKLAYRIAEFNIPVLAAIDWNHIGEALLEIDEKGPAGYVVDNIDWKDLGKKLVLAKAEESGVPLQTIETMMGYVNQILVGQGESEISTTPETNLLCSAETSSNEISIETSENNKEERTIPASENLEDYNSSASKDYVTINEVDKPTEKVLEVEEGGEGKNLPDKTLEKEERKNALEELKQLKELLDMGAVSQAEFEEVKKRILARIL